MAMGVELGSVPLMQSPPPARRRGPRRPAIGAAVGGAGTSRYAGETEVVPGSRLWYSAVVETISGPEASG